MTNIEDELTIAPERRVRTVAVQDHLDAILEDVNIIRLSGVNRAHPRRGRLLTAAVPAGVGGLIWVNNTRTEDPVASSSLGTSAATNVTGPSSSVPGPSPDTISSSAFPARSRDPAPSSR